MKLFIRNNSLSICFFILFIAALMGQIGTGFNVYNSELNDAGTSPVSLSSYLISGHFIQSTFENWESEFLQMMLFVVLTIFLQQKGSSESKDFDATELVDREPSKHRHNVPWPVRSGGIWLSIYKNSLTIALSIAFILSFLLHFYGSLTDENQQHFLLEEAPSSPLQYLFDS